MFTKSFYRIAALLLTFSFPILHLPQLHAQTSAGDWTDAEKQSLALQIAKKIRSLTTYSVFDDVGFGFQGKTVVLHGYASRPALKSDATRAVKSVKGVESVDNQLEVLPFSSADDQVRATVYNAIYTEPSLRKYNAGAGNLASAGMGPSPAMAAGGITEDPPLGFHAIHIIVKNGNLILVGTVLNKQDAELAALRAGSAFGVHNVTNQLTVQGASPEK
jgi:hyperosmotically inducible periplasmic protein